MLAIVIDDASIACCGDVWSTKKARAIVSAALDELGPEDVAAVTATMINHAAQGFTKDRQLVVGVAAQRYDRFWRTGFQPQWNVLLRRLRAAGPRARYAGAVIVSRTAQDSDVRQRGISAGHGLGVRVASGLPPAFSSLHGDCSAVILGHTIKTLRNATHSRNIAIEAVHPDGLCTLGPASSRTPSSGVPFIWEHTARRRPLVDARSR